MIENSKSGILNQIGEVLVGNTHVKVNREDSAGQYDASNYINKKPDLTP